MKIALFTNISRSYCLHRQNMERLMQEAPRIEGRGWLFESGTEWSAEWAARFDEADVILILWMGTGLDTPHGTPGEPLSHFGGKPRHR